jgi:hypothetical protein
MQSLDREEDVSNVNKLMLCQHYNPLTLIVTIRLSFSFLTTFCSCLGEWVPVATPVEEALMASESLRTLESPETSNVLAAEGSPERRKRKQLVGRDVGAQASVEVSHLHRLLLDFPEQIGL